MVGNILEALFDSVIWPILLFLVIWWIPSYIVILLINRHFRKIEKELERWIWLRKVKIRNGDVWGNKVIVEYQPPKWLNPTEVWFLYDWSVWKPDIICMVYKWVNMWLVSLEYKWWEIVVKKLLNIKSWLPSYEQVFWNIVFKRWNTVKFPNEKIYWELWMVKDSLLRYCKRMGRIWKSFVYFSFDSIDKNSYIPFWRLIWLFSWGLMVIFWFVTPLFTNSEILLALSLIIPVVWLFVILCFWTSLYETQKKSVLKFTENWKKIVAKIYWYKKFLESCEEDQLKKLMKEDLLYFDKTLPYAIALGLEDTISKKIPKNVISSDNSIADMLRLEKIL